MARVQLLRVVILATLALTAAACSSNEEPVTDPPPANNDTPDVVDDDPDIDEPDADEPDADEPDVDDGPDVDEPDIDEPDVDEPDVDEPDIDEPDIDEPDVPQVDCESFALVEDRLFALPLRTVAVVATGGSGQYTWSAAPGNQPDSSVNANTGIYLSGQAEGVMDRVVVTDDVCERSLEAEIEVVERAQLLPGSPIVPPSRQVCFEVAGGSGDQYAPDSPFVWEILPSADDNNSTVGQDGCYRSGPNPGRDFLQVTDTRTGQVLQATIEISNNIALEASAKHLSLPVGESFSVSVEGGSGLFTFEVLPPNTAGVNLEVGEGNQEVKINAGDTAGAEILVIRDAFLSGTEVRVPINVMGEANHEPNPYGNHSDDVDVIGVGDVNGDGVGDVMTSMRHASLNGYQSGAAFLYLGGQEGGLAQTPAQTIVGGRRFENLGRSLAAGDFNNDGCQDVAVGVYAEDRGRSEVGEVRIFTGCHQDDAEDPLRPDWNGRLNDNLPFDPEANGPLRLWRSVGGVNNGDRFGWSVTSGDFNGDGLDDLAVAAYRAEASAQINPDNGDPYRDLGRVYVFLQDEEEGIRELAQIFIDGQTVSPEGDLTGAQQLQYGSGRLASGDANGDGCDDLLVGSAFYNGNHGVATLHLSIQDGDGCTLDPLPAVAVVPGEQDSRRAGRVGRDVALADINGDCLADMVIGQYTAAIIDGANNNAGAVNIFVTDPGWSSQTPVHLPRDQAQIIFEGDSNDQYGNSLDVGDVTNDGINDLIVGIRFGEGPDTVPDVGEVIIYPGLIDDTTCLGPLEEDAPLFGESYSVFNAAHRNADFFGDQVAVVGDIDGDELNDWVTLAARGPAVLDDPTDHRGRLFWSSGAELEPTYETLGSSTFTAPMTDDAFGTRVENVGDINNDGFADFAVTAPLWDRMWDRDTYMQAHSNAGAVYLFLGGRDGVPERPDAILAENVKHSGGDQFGYSVFAAGDFDGDGIDDLAVSAIADDNESWCTVCRESNRYRGDTGTVFIYRGRADLAVRRAEDAPMAVVTQPDFVFCGPQENNIRVGRELGGGADINGDGFDDVVASNWNHQSQRGKVWALMGRQHQGGAPDAICMSNENDLIGQGDNNGDLVGHGLGLAADLNNDGCADIVASGYNDDGPGRSNSGIVHVWLGWGGRGCPTEPVHVAFYAERANDNLGYRLITPGDVDGDGVEDLAVSAVGYGVTNEGVVLVLSGQEMGDALEGATEGDAIALTPEFIIARVVDPEGLPNTNYGYGLTALGDVNGDGLGDFAAGARRSSASGQLRSGAAYVYLGSDDAEELVKPDMIIAGHLTQPDGEFGRSVAGGKLNPRQDGWVLFVGAPFAEVDGPSIGEMGAVYMTLIEE